MPAAPTTPTSSRTIPCRACRGYFQSDKTLKAHWSKSNDCFKINKTGTPTPTSPVENTSSSQIAAPSSAPLSTLAETNSFATNGVGFCRLLPEAFHFQIDEHPGFYTSVPGPPRDPPQEPTTNPDIVKFYIGYIKDTAGHYQRGDVTVHRNGMKACARLKMNGPNPGIDYEYIDDTGTVVKVSDVWLSKKYGDPSSPDASDILTDIANAYTKHLDWLKTAQEDYEKQYGKWRQERLNWEATLAVNLALNGKGRWKLRTAPGRILNLGNVTANQIMNSEIFRQIKPALIDLANENNDVPPPPSQNVSTFDI